jgi:hypothetical protein
MRCGCEFNSQTGQPNPVCSVCAGTGREFFDPREIKCLFENVTIDIDPQNDFGIWYKGLARVSVRAEHPVSYRDRITMLDAAVEFEELLERDADNPGPIFRLRYRIVTRMVSLEDVVTEEEVIVAERIIRARVWRADGSTHLLREHRDFVVQPDGRLDLSRGDRNGNAPETGDRLALKYVMNPAWVVVALDPQYFRSNRDQYTPRPEDLIQFPRSLLVGVDYLVQEEDED